MPTRGVFARCCASAASGAASTAPRPVTKARRFIGGAMLAPMGRSNKVPWRTPSAGVTTAGASPPAARSALHTRRTPTTRARSTRRRPDHHSVGARGRRRRSPGAAGRSSLHADPSSPLVTVDRPALLLHRQPPLRRTALVCAGFVLGHIALVTALHDPRPRPARHRALADLLGSDGTPRPGTNATHSINANARYVAGRGIFHRRKLHAGPKVDCRKRFEKLWRTALLDASFPIQDRVLGEPHSAL